MANRFDDDFEDVTVRPGAGTADDDFDLVDTGRSANRRWTDTAEQYLDHMDETERAAREAEEAVSENPVADEIRARAAMDPESDRARRRNRPDRRERADRDDVREGFRREGSAGRRPTTDDDRRRRNEEIRRANREERERLRRANGDPDDGGRRRGGSLLPKILIALIALAICAGGFYAASRLKFGNVISDLGPKNENYYEKHFLPYTTINGVDVSNKTPDEAKELLAKALADYTLTITGREADQVLDAEAGKLSIREDLDLTSYLDSQNHEDFERTEEAGDTLTVEGVAQADEFHVRDAIASLPIFNSGAMTMSQDAYVYYDPEADDFVLVDGVAGTWVDVNAVADRAIACYESLTPTLDLAEENFYVPTIQVTDQMREDVKEMSKYLDADVKIAFDENHIETLGKESLSGCVKLTYEGRAEFDENGVISWLGELSNKYDTAGHSHTFTTTEGKTISVTGGTYGWLMDYDAMTEKVVEAIKSGTPTTLEPIYEQTANVKGSRDIGSTYVEVSLEHQRLYYYKDGVRVQSADIISGDVSKGYDTPEGVYFITDKVKDFTLPGNDDVPDREVSYWLPFTEAYGLTGASWRQAFGGTIYLNDGSLGSIYMDEEDAEALYQTVETGTPVVIYAAQKELPPETTPETREERTTERERERETEATQATRSTESTRATETEAPTTKAPTQDQTEEVVETDPPETDPPETDPPETDPPETDPPETDPPEPVDPPEPDEIEG